MSEVLSATFEALTSSFTEDGLNASFELATGDFAGPQGALGDMLASLEAISGAFTSPGNGDGSLDATFEPLTSSFDFPSALVASVEPLTSSFVGAPGSIGYIVASFNGLDGAFVGVSPHNGSLTGSLQAMTGQLAGSVGPAGGVAAALYALRGAFAGSHGQLATMAVSLKQMAGSFSGSVIITGALATQLPRMRGYFAGGPSLAATLDTWATNTRSNAVTKHPSLPANSFARYNGTYLFAGPSGLFELGGEVERGAQWRVRTGQLDDKRTALKRLTEVLLALRYEQAMTVRVWTGDDKYYDYALPARKTDAIQQVRAKVGRGLRSRYYKVELIGTGIFELDSLQATMPETTRRIG